MKSHLGFGQRTQLRTISEPVNYKYKYHKYLTKYLSRLTASNAAKTIRDQLEEFIKQVDLYPLTPILVEQIGDFFELAVKWSYDTENMHKLEDRLATRFVADVAEGLYDHETQRIVASKIKEINDLGYHKWFD